MTRDEEQSARTHFFRMAMDGVRLQDLFVWEDEWPPVHAFADGDGMVACARCGTMVHASRRANMEGQRCRR